MRAITLLTIGLLVAAGAQAGDAASKEAKELQGEWQAVEVEKDGKKVTADDVKDLRIVFKGGEFIAKSAKGEGKERKSKFTLDPSKSPKQIDITPLEGPDKGQTAACIYSLENGQLKLCMPYFKDLGTRPKEFKTQAGDGRMLFVLKRVKRATGLGTIKRVIAKEPAYQSKSPKYCLLVFGPEAEMRVWLVLDGDVLYVDRNANGDLTEQGERLAIHSDLLPHHVFHAKNLADKDGKVKVTGLLLTRFDNLTRNQIAVSFEGKRRQYVGTGPEGDLQFADRPQEAPVIHFGGPLTLRLSRPLELAAGNTAQELYVEVGTPGLGKGTFAALAYEAVTKDVHPVAVIEFPSKKSGGKPVPVRVELTSRC